MWRSMGAGMSDSAFLGAVELGTAFDSGDLSPIEVTDATLARIADLDGSLQCYALVLQESARREAAQAASELAAGHRRGPLHGVPVAVKDLCDVAGSPTMAGTAVLRDNVANSDATIVRRLREAGAVILGKLNLTEGAMGGYHPDLDVPINPWGDNLWAGVSSSGSGAATAAGFCVASLGSDTGGSIRFPAAANGVVGLKPTYGRVSRSGVFPLAESLDHIGPLARNTFDAALVFEAIAGDDPADQTTVPTPVEPLTATIDAGVDGLRIGVDRAYATKGVDPATSAAVLAAVEVLAGLGAEITEIEMPAFDDPAWFVICGAEAAVAHAAYYPDRADEYGGYFREFLAHGNQVTGVDVAAAQHKRSIFAGKLTRLLTEVDVIACPTMHGPAFEAPPDMLRGSFEEVMSLSPEFGLDFTARFNLSGSPTISLPSGFNNEGLPLSVQFVGRHFEEAALCQVGHAFESATDWHNHHPNLG